MDRPREERGSTHRFTVERRGQADLYRFDGSPLYFTADLSARDALLEALTQTMHDDEVRAAILFGFPEKTAQAEYTSFFRRAQVEAQSLQLQRMVTVFNQFILTLVECPKLVIFVDSGEVSSQFFNVSLACDYRILGDDTVVQKTYLRHGMIPKGGALFFLTSRVGRGKAFELLLSPEPLRASQALALGLVDEVVPVGELERAALAAAERLAQAPSGTVAGLKRLMNFEWRDLRTYLDFESKELMKALRQADFSG